MVMKHLLNRMILQVEGFGCAYLCFFLEAPNFSTKKSNPRSCYQKRIQVSLPKIRDGFHGLIPSLPPQGRRVETGFRPSLRTYLRTFKLEGWCERDSWFDQKKGSLTHYHTPFFAGKFSPLRNKGQTWAVLKYKKTKHTRKTPNKMHGTNWKDSGSQILVFTAVL